MGILLPLFVCGVEEVANHLDTAAVVYDHTSYRGCSLDLLLLWDRGFYYHRRTRLTFLGCSSAAYITTGAMERTNHAKMLGACES
eukprot:scaffold1595_cov171-Amphora_coffeaeformis.AAC.15